jgi:hypothetical protein
LQMKQPGSNSVSVRVSADWSSSVFNVMRR